jgi:hypothetical protein
MTMLGSETDLMTVVRQGARVRRILASQSSET